jgi:hypothetical protein
MTLKTTPHLKVSHLGTSVDSSSVRKLTFQFTSPLPNPPNLNSLTLTENTGVAGYMNPVHEGGSNAANWKLTLGPNEFSPLWNFATDPNHRQLGLYVDYNDANPYTVSNITIDNNNPLVVQPFKRSSLQMEEADFSAGVT